MQTTSALQPFFDQVKQLYAKAQAGVHEPYQYLLYHVEHPLHESTTEMVEQAFHLPSPHWTPGSRVAAISALDGCQYPDTFPVATIPDVPGLGMRTLSHYLHFFHHAYPIYDEASCRGLAKLGYRITFSDKRDPTAYAAYIKAIEELKERVPFWDVPETNVYLTRIVQAALAGYGAI